MIKYLCNRPFSAFYSHQYSKIHELWRDVAQLSDENSKKGLNFGDSIEVTGRVHQIREKGKMLFLIMRESPAYTLQCCNYDPKMGNEIDQLRKSLKSLKSEDIIKITGILKKGRIKSCSIKNAELEISDCEVIEKSVESPSIQIEFLSKVDQRQSEQIDD